jgi:hypothetical protein
MGRPGLLGAVARTAVVAGTATAVSGGVRRRSAQRQANSEPAQAATATAPSTPPASVPTSATAPAGSAAPAAMTVEDQVTKIKALGELKNNGLLTDDEFDAEKAKVLAL